MSREYNTLSASGHGVVDTRSTLWSQRDRNAVNAGAELYIFLIIPPGDVRRIELGGQVIGLVVEGVAVGGIGLPSPHRVPRENSKPPAKRGANRPSRADSL